ncbi:MAG: WG repeat-containing protein [Ignavibacteria bacterium]
MKAVVIILIFLSVNITSSQSLDTLYPVKVYTQAGYKYGYINREGNITIKPQFAFARDFSEGRAFVKIVNNSSVWLCINTSNLVQFEIEAEYAFDFINGQAKMINKNDSTFFIDTLGNRCTFKAPPIDFNAKKTLIPFFDNLKWGYKLGPEVIVLPAIYEVAGEFSENLAPVFIKFNESDLPEDNCYNAFIDKQGNVLIKAELKYDDRGHLESGYFYSPGNWVNGVCRYYTSNDPNTKEVKYNRSDGKIIW